MTPITETIWKIEPHTKAKHEILRRYLGAWFGIMGPLNPNILFIDGFCGPGRYIGGEVGSPIIALQTAISHNNNYRIKNATFVFIDADNDRIKYLNNEISKLTIPKNFQILVLDNEFEETISNLLNDIEMRQGKLIPSFVFIDPFGFKGAPYKLVERLLKNPKNEIFINIMADSINRFLEHPDIEIRNHIVELFGTDEVLEIVNSGGDRVKKCRDLYRFQLAKCAKFIRYFEMRDESYRMIYYLFFATNNRLGHIKMKEALWCVDCQSGISFSDATDPDQLVLISTDPSDEICKILNERFHNQRIEMLQILRFIEDDTPFISRHLRKSLKSLEEKGKIEVEPFKIDGTKRRKNSFPDDTIIKFL